MTDEASAATAAAPAPAPKKKAAEAAAVPVLILADGLPYAARGVVADVSAAIRDQLIAQGKGTVPTEAQLALAKRA